MSKIATSDAQAHPTEVAEELDAEKAVSALERDAVAVVSGLLDADIYVYSGELDREGANRFIDVVEQSASKESKESGALILATHGGMADAAYRVARHIRRRYKNFILYVFGPCKSAGTLLALAADEIVMSCRAEFGPLDVQLVKRDDLAFRNSGLDITEALSSLSVSAFDIFEKQFLEMIQRSGGAISTGTAGSIAQSISAELLKPITAQIDPLQVGEVQRALKVASDYAERLGADTRVIQRLVRGYSSHSFVIDFEEAQSLFKNVRLTSRLESLMEQSLIASSRAETGHDCIREPYPHRGAVIAFLEPEAEQTDEPEQEQDVPERGTVISDGRSNADEASDSSNNA